VRYLLDTCVLSDLASRRPSQPVVAWIGEQDENALALSVLTLGELHKGIAGISDERRRRKLEAWVEGDLRERFEGRILPVDEVVARTWGRIQARAPRSLPVVDGLIAATAIAHGLVVVTRNVHDMEPSGVEVLDPWSR